MMILNILAEYENYDHSYLLDPQALRIGFAFGGHPKFGQMFQSLLLISTSNSVY